jgi:hypothetical protein
MENEGKKQRKPRECRRIPKHVRTFILKKIAAYRDNKEILEEVSSRYGMNLSENTINNNYRFSKQYKARIEEYRRKYNAEVDDHPFQSKSFVLDCYKQIYKDAIASGDRKSALKAIQNACKITGLEAPETLEISHTHSGASTFEERLAAILAASRQPQALDGQSIPALEDKSKTIDVTPNPTPQD